MGIYEIIKEKVNIVKEDRKSLSLEVCPDMTITAKVPHNIENFIIDRFIEKRSVWAYKKLEYFKQFQNPFIQQYISGSTIKYLGRQYMLKIEESEKNYTKFTKSRFYLYTKYTQNINYNKNLIDKYMIEQANIVFNNRLDNCLIKFKNIERPTIKIRKLKKRWGSYSKKNNTIILNNLLIMADVEAIDYVITHELCHYFHYNHSPAFYRMLEEKIPNWKDIKHKMELYILTYT